MARFTWEMTPQDREDIRWYLEDYLQYPIEPAPTIAARVERRLAELGRELFGKVFEADRDTTRLWDAVSDSLADTRVEVVNTVEDAAAVPWELLREPATDTVLALRARAFVRADPQAPQAPVLPKAAEMVRVLLVICRPGDRDDVPFRSVASHLVRLSRDAREAFQLDVLRPPTFTQLARVLEAARRRGRPYHVVHFDGHGAYLGKAQVEAAQVGDAGRLDPEEVTDLPAARPRFSNTHLGSTCPTCRLNGEHGSWSMSLVRTGSAGRRRKRCVRSWRRKPSRPSKCAPMCWSGS